MCEHVVVVPKMLCIGCGSDVADKTATIRNCNIQEIVQKCSQQLRKSLCCRMITCATKGVSLQVPCGMLQSDWTAMYRPLPRMPSGQLCQTSILLTKTDTNFLTRHDYILDEACIMIA